MNLDLLDAREEFLDKAAISGSARYIEEHGLDHRGIEAHSGCVGLVRGEMLSGGRWDFHADGEALAVIEVFAADDESVVDLCAWPADGDPARFATMFGIPAVLGAARIENPSTYFNDAPLRVFRTPLAWLQAGCQGAVVLDRDRAIDLLAEAPGRIAGEDHAHSRELARLLRHYVDQNKVVAPIRRAA